MYRFKNDFTDPVQQKYVFTKDTSVSGMGSIISSKTFKKGDVILGYLRQRSLFGGVQPQCIMAPCGGDDKVSYVQYNEFQIPMENLRPYGNEVIASIKASTKPTHIFIFIAIAAVLYFILKPKK